MTVVLLVILCCFLGAIPSALIIGKLVRGIDIRDYGSGNVGTTNALRTLGIGPSIVVFVLDFGKGTLAALIGLNLGGSMAAAVACSLAAVIGHNWPIYIRFRGGRGVATSLGAFIVMTPVVCITVITVGLILIAITRYVSLGSVVGAALSPILVLGSLWLGAPFEPVVYAFIAAPIVLFRHRANIGRLLAGREHRLGQKVPHTQ